MSWPEATSKIVEAVCLAVVIVALIAGFLGININIRRGPK